MRGSNKGKPMVSLVQLQGQFLPMHGLLCRGSLFLLQPPMHPPAKCSCLVSSGAAMEAARALRILTSRAAPGQSRPRAWQTGSPTQRTSFRGRYPETRCSSSARQTPRTTRTSPGRSTATTTATQGSSRRNTPRLLPARPPFPPPYSPAVYPRRARHDDHDASDSHPPVTSRLLSKRI